MGKPVFDTDVVADNGQILTAKTPEQLQRFKDMGYRTAGTQDIKRDEIRKVYDSWGGAVAAAGQGILNGIPGFNTAYTNIKTALQGENAAQDYAQQAQTLTEIHPFIGGLGQTLSSGLYAVGGSAAAAPSLLAQMATGAVTNVALGAANFKDRAAMAHAVEPGGEEKLGAHLGHDLMVDAAIGAAVPAGLSGLGKLASKLAGLSEGLADSQAVKGMFDAKKLSTIYDQGMATRMGGVMKEYGLMGKSVEEARAIADSKLGQLANDFNEIKSTVTLRVPPERSASLLEDVGNILTDTHADKLDSIKQQLSEYGNSPNLGELHNLRQSMDRHIEFKSGLSDEQAAFQAPLLQVRDRIDREMGRLMADYDANATSGAMSEKWQKVSRDYGAFTTIKNTLRKSADSEDKMNWSMGMVANLMGGHVVKAANLAYQGAKDFHNMYVTGAFAKPARTLAKIFDKFSERMTQATEAGLLGAAAEASSTMHANAHTDDDYDIKTAQVRHMMGDKAGTFSKLAGAALAAGLPDEMTQAQAIRAQAMQDYLFKGLPGSPGLNYSAGMNTKFRPPREQRMEWIGVYNTLNDPSYGLLNPTQANVAAMQKFYPDTLANAQHAVISQLQNNHELPLESQTWASRLLGYSVSTLTSPAFYATLQQTRQAIDKQNQAAGQKLAKVEQGGSPGQQLQGESGDAMTPLQKLQAGKVNGRKN